MDYLNPEQQALLVDQIQQLCFTIQAQYHNQHHFIHPSTTLPPMPGRSCTPYQGTPLTQFAPSAQYWQLPPLPPPPTSPAPSPTREGIYPSDQLHAWSQQAHSLHPEHFTPNAHAPTYPWSVTPTDVLGCVTCAHNNTTTHPHEQVTTPIGPTHTSAAHLDTPAHLLAGSHNTMAHCPATVTYTNYPKPSYSRRIPPSPPNNTNTYLYEPHRTRR